MKHDTRKNLGKPSGKLVARQVTWDLRPHVGGECGSCVADTCPLAHRPQPRALTSFCRHSNVMRLVTSQKQSTSFDHIHDCLLRFLTQMTPVLNGCGSTITSNPNPHNFFMWQICTRQAENSRSKQNDVLHCRVSVLGVTDIRVAGSFFLILAYLARPRCVQREVNWAISAVTQISDKNAAKIIKLLFELARWALHTKDITQASQHPFCRPTYRMRCCITDVTSQSRILLDTLAVARLVKNFPAFPWTRKNVFSGNYHSFFTEPVDWAALYSAVSIRNFRILSSYLNQSL